MSYGYWNRKMEPSESMQPSKWIEKLEQYAKTQGATSEHFFATVLGKMIFLNAHPTLIGARTAGFALILFEQLDPAFGLDVWIDGDRLDQFLPRE
jgi:hypothetical protein